MGADYQFCQAARCITRTYGTATRLIKVGEVSFTIVLCASHWATLSKAGLAASNETKGELPPRPTLQPATGDRVAILERAIQTLQQEKRAWGRERQAMQSDTLKLIERLNASEGKYAELANQSQELVTRLRRQARTITARDETIRSQDVNIRVQVERIRALEEEARAATASVLQAAEHDRRRMQQRGRCQSRCPEHGHQCRDYAGHPFSHRTWGGQRYGFCSWVDSEHTYVQMSEQEQGTAA